VARPKRSVGVVRSTSDSPALRTLERATGRQKFVSIVQVESFFVKRELCCKDDYDAGYSSMNFRSPELTTNPSLLIRLRNVEDRLAWGVFVEVYGPVIFSYCRRRNLQASDASDVSQEVFAILSKTLPTFEYSAQRGRFRDWLGLVTHRELIRFWKRKERVHRLQSSEGQLEVETAEAPDGWDNHFHSELLLQAMKRIHDSFEPETWEIFQRIWIGGELAVKVASSLNIKIGSVYVAKSRVLKRLRAEVLMLSDDFPAIE
jgi:RNA polymerase sigma factor (sigma-70 family)